MCNTTFLTHLIVCESTETGIDKTLITKLLKSLSKDFNPQIIQPKLSIKNLIEFLNKGILTDKAVTTNNLQSLIIIVDADENPERRFFEIVSNLDDKVFNCQNK